VNAIDASVTLAIDAASASDTLTVRHVYRPLEFTALALYVSDASVVTDRHRLATVIRGPEAM
jgi:hypothetical protein